MILNQKAGYQSCDRLLQVEARPRKKVNLLVSRMVAKDWFGMTEMPEVCGLVLEILFEFLKFGPNDKVAVLSLIHI